MTSIAVLGATGNLGGELARQITDRGWDLSVLVRSPDKLCPRIAAAARVTVADINTVPAVELSRFAQAHDALVCCAGQVTHGASFVALFDRVVSAMEAIAPELRPVCWFLAGAAMLDLDARGRRGVELPKVRDTYWPHRVDFERLQRSNLDWRLLCPGPMVDQPAIGIERLRISCDTLPAPLPDFARFLPTPLLLPLFASRIPQMIIPYADAANLMLANLGRDGAMPGKRVGIALPVGMRGSKSQWAAKPVKPR